MRTPREIPGRFSMTNIFRHRGVGGSDGGLGDLVVEVERCVVGEVEHECFAVDVFETHVAVELAGDLIRGVELGLAGGASLSSFDAFACAEDEADGYLIEGEHFAEPVHEEPLVVVGEKVGVVDDEDDCWG